MINIILSWPFLILLIIISFGVQRKVVHTIGKYHKVKNIKGIRGKELAEMMLKRNGITDVKIHSGKGKWVSDFYDPRKKIVNLSPQVYASDSMSALAVSAHEVGHAIQHKESYSPLMIRNTVYPISQLGSKLGPILIIGGMIFQISQLAVFGVYFYAAAVFFTVLNLPVEFNASSRAKEWLFTQGIVSTEEKKIVDKILFAAAMTYVMAALISVIELIRMFLLTRD